MSKLLVASAFVAVFVVSVTTTLGAAGPCVLPGDGYPGNGQPLRYTVLTDGTIQDLNTGLQWEHKTTGTGIHGVERTFTWTQTGLFPNGSLFTEFLDALNNRCDGDQATVCSNKAGCAGIGSGLCGYAGHRDWRIPNVKELISIVDYSRFQPAVVPLFEPIRPINPVPWWSVTTSGHLATAAMFVNFDDGSINNQPKEDSLSARAVRDSQCRP